MFNFFKTKPNENVSEEVKPLPNPTVIEFVPKRLFDNSPFTWRRLGKGPTSVLLLLEGGTKMAVGEVYLSELNGYYTAIVDYKNNYFSRKTINELHAMEHIEREVAKILKQEQEQKKEQEDMNKIADMLITFHDRETENA